MNKGYEITARVPSIMIAGGSNFPVRKKEKQNAAADKNMEEYREIQGLLDKIRSTGMGGISADDPNAVSKLENKLAKAQEAQTAAEPGQDAPEQTADKKEPDKDTFSIYQLQPGYLLPGLPETYHPQTDRRAHEKNAGECDAIGAK